MGAQMSPMAERLMNFGVWFRGASVVIAVVFFSVLLVAFLAYAIAPVRDGLIRVFRDKWGGSGIFGRVASFQFISSMTLALSSGLMTEESIDLAASLNSSSKALKQKYEKCKAVLNEGGKLSDALRDAGILCARDCRMLSLGDQSGMADNAMAEIARRNDRTVQDEIAGLVSRIEPTLVILTSAVIGIILLSVMLPLIGIMTSIG
jgi:type IV pilus assembly protein PilC